MSYWTDTAIEKLNLVIPKNEFPLRSDLIVGHKYPTMFYPEDEGSYGEMRGIVREDNVIFASDKMFWHDSSNRISELEELCVKYGGTLIATEEGEESGDVSYIRIRDGVKKNVRIIEED